MSAAAAILVTASKVGLLPYCSWWATPEAKHDDGRSVEADAGDRFHKAIRNYTATRKRETVGEDIAALYAHACDYVDSLGLPEDPPALLLERSFAWDPATDAAEVIGYDRDYSKGNGRLCGTVDLVMLVMVDGKVVGAMVWDWKTGDSLSSGPQLRTLGLMVARAFGISQVTVAALDVGPAGVTETCREEMDDFALSAVAGELAEQIAAIGATEPQPGSHCSELFCPAKLHCPVAEKAASEVVDVIPADKLVRRPEFRLTDPIETAEHAMWAVDVCRLIGAKLDAIKDDIKAKVPADGWKAEDGRVLKEGSCDSTGFDKTKALALCRQLGATDAQIESLNYTYQKSTGLRVSGGGAKPRAKRSSKKAAA